jgi:phosphoglycolate phosphatase
MPSRGIDHTAATVLAVFDLDGTLIDSRRDLADSANVMLAGYGARPLDEEHITSMVGCGAATLVKRVMTAADVDAPLEEGLARFLAAYDERLTQYTRPYVGIPDLLDELRSRPVAMALLTNKPLAQSVRILDVFGLSKYFQWVIGGDGPWPRKPEPDGLRFLMHQATAGPSETVLVGDSTIDLQTSRNAGVRICLARYGFGFADLAVKDLRGDEWLVDTPAEIAGVLHGGR